jgi:hypothetical protein
MAIVELTDNAPMRRYANKNSILNLKVPRRFIKPKNAK